MSFEKRLLWIIPYSQEATDSRFEIEFDDVTAEIGTAVVIVGMIELFGFAQFNSR